jgi:Protein of unknown function (DUF2917)
MNHPVMNIVQQKRGEGGLKSWALGSESRVHSITLRTGRQASVLKVEHGLAWVTLPGTASQAPQDLWLFAGQSLPLAARQTLWVDGWPHAELSVQVAERATVRQLLGFVQRVVLRLRRRTVTSRIPCSAA